MFIVKTVPNVAQIRYIDVFFFFSDYRRFRYLFSMPPLKFVIKVSENMGSIIKPISAED